MVHFALPDELVDALRPIVETLWERERREAGKGSISATEVMQRVSMRFYEQNRGKSLGWTKSTVDASSIFKK